MFSKTVIEATVKTAITEFLPQAIEVEVERQRAVYAGEKNITNVLTKSQEKAKRDGKPFEPDMDRARKYAEHSLRFGIGKRLEGAQANLVVGDVEEWARHTLLALGAAMSAIGYEDAGRAISDCNDSLMQLKRKKEAA